VISDVGRPSQVNPVSVEADRMGMETEVLKTGKTSRAVLPPPCDVYRWKTTSDGGGVGEVEEGVGGWGNRVPQVVRRGQCEGLLRVCEVHAILAVEMICETLCRLWC
jgi:hypothetical protein